MNQLKAFGFLIGLSIFLLLVCYLLAGHSGVYIAVFLVIFMNISALLYADKLILAMYSPNKVSADTHPELFNHLTELSEKANMAVPDLYLLESDAVNGLSIGRNPKNAALILTTGLVNKLDQSALMAVLSYLITQIQTRSTFLDVISASVAHSVFAFFNLEAWKKTLGIRSDEKPSDEAPLNAGGFIAAPIASLLMRLVVGRNRVFELDMAAANLCDDSKSLMQALEILSEQQSHHAFPLADLHPSSAILFVTNPIKNVRLSRYFGFFPDVEARIANLKSEVE